MAADAEIDALCSLPVALIPGADIQAGAAEVCMSQIGSVQMAATQIRITQ